MADRAARYRAKAQAKKPRTDVLLIACVQKTSKGKIRLRKIVLQKEGEKEVTILDKLPVEDPRYVFEDNYKVRKATHDLVRRSGKYTRFWDTGVRVFYELE